MKEQEWAFGINSIEMLLTHHLERVLEIVVVEETKNPKIKALVQLASREGISVREGRKRDITSLVGDVNHQGIVAKTKPIPNYQETDLLELIEKAHNKPFFLILDGVQDPHNLGACLRTANAAGVTAVIVPKDKSASLNATVRKVACGAAELTPLVTVTNLVRCIKQLQEAGVWVYGAAGDADETLYSLKLSRPLAIVMGAEDQGMRRLTRETCDGLFAIPMQGQMESLNVSVATGVVAFEVLRQAK